MILSPYATRSGEKSGLVFTFYDGNGTQKGRNSRTTSGGSTSSTVASASPDANKGIWLRCLANTTSAAINGVPAYSVQFFTAPDNGYGSPGAWTQLGVTQAFTTNPVNGMNAIGSKANGLSVGSTGGSTDGYIKGNVYKIKVSDGTNVLDACDFTAQPSIQNGGTFKDGLGLTWNLSGVSIN